MSPKLKKPVPDAEANTPKKDDSPPKQASEAPKAAPASEPVTPGPEPISISNLVKGISPEKLKMAQGLGIPLEGILQWANAIEQNVVAQGQALRQLGVDLRPLIDAIQKKEQMNAQQTQQAPQAQASATSGLPLGEIIREGLNQLRGGNQGDEFYGLFKEQIIKSGMASMQSDQELGRAVKQAVVSQLAGKISAKAIVGEG